MPAEDDYNVFSAMAERMQLDEDESENFISSGMKRLGYKARTAWDEADDNDGKDKGDFFSSKKKERETRTMNTDRRRAANEYR